MKKIFLFLLLHGFLLAQEDFAYSQEKIYDASIFTAQLYKGNNQTALPVLTKERGEFLTLEFDVLGNLYDDLEAKIIPADRNWKPLQLFESEFYQGFPVFQITEYDACDNCIKSYTHYRLTFPRNNEKFLVSGNFLLVVYRMDEPENILLTRRFWVSENLLFIQAETQISPNTEQRFSSQYIQFSIAAGTLNITDPTQDLDVVILQNNSWNTQVTLDKPTYIYPDKYEYVVQPEQFFPAGNEFRNIDLTRLTTGRGQGISSLDITQDGYVAKLFPDEPRNQGRYFAYRDMNGNFYVISKENSRTATQAEYVMTNFYLFVPSKLQGEVCVYGKISDWGNDERFKMEYLEEYAAYHLQIPLKQGFYNYLYALKKDARRDISAIEGSYFETENAYTIFVYYRPFGERYDRLIGVKFLENY